MGAFLAFLVQGLPFFGKVTEAFTNYTNKKMDTDLGKYTVKGQVDTEAMKQDTAIIQARTELAIVMKDDPAGKWGRRLFIYPTGAWYAFVVWRSLVQENSLLQDYSWVVKALPNNLEYIPHAVVAYLLVTAWKK